MAKRRKSWEYITNEATSDRGLSQKDRVSFHYHNPNGAYATLRAAWQRVNDLVDSGAVKSGWLLAYGSLNMYAYNELNRVANLARPDRLTVWSMVERLLSDAETANRKVDEFLAANPSVTLRQAA